MNWSFILILCLMSAVLCQPPNIKRVEFIKIISAIGLLVFGIQIIMNISSGFKGGMIQSDISSGIYSHVFDNTYTESLYKTWRTDESTMADAKRNTEVISIIFGVLALVFWYLLFSQNPNVGSTERNPEKIKDEFYIVKNKKFFIASVFTLLMQQGAFMAYLFLGY